MNQRYRPDDQRNDPRRRDPSGPESQGDRYGDYGEQRYRAERSWREDEYDGPSARNPGGGRRGLYGQYRAEQLENPGYGQEQYARGFGSGPGRFDRDLGDVRAVGHYDVGTYSPEPYYGSVRPDPRDRGGDLRRETRGTAQYDRGSGYDTGWHERGRGSDRHRQQNPVARGGRGGEYAPDDFGQEDYGRFGNGGSGRFEDARRFEPSRGPYYGRGPRNYRRSDERIAEDLNERLTDDAYLDASDIEVQVNSGVACLSGAVSERWMKHRAEDIADACGGVNEVDNQLRVQSSSPQERGESQRWRASGAPASGGMGQSMDQEDRRPLEKNGKGGRAGSGSAGGPAASSSRRTTTQ